MIAINASLTYKIINFGPKGPVLPLHINNTQEKMRNRTKDILDFFTQTRYYQHREYRRYKRQCPVKR